MNAEPVPVIIPAHVESKLQSLRRAGWNVAARLNAADERDLQGTRYAWVPDSVRDFQRWTARAENPDRTAWFILQAELEGTSDCAFSWDAWERMSLDAAEGDGPFGAGVRAFWDDHYPIVQHVTTYGHLSLRHDGLTIVSGMEPEFEECSPVAGNFDELFLLFGERSALLRELL